MDTTLKQRIVGIVVLIGLLGFCLTVLLHNTKSTQPHIAKINTHPDLIQTALAPAPVAVVNATPAKPAVTTEINKSQPVADVTIPPPVPVKTTTTPNPAKQPASMTVMPAPGPVTQSSLTGNKNSVMPISSENKISENKVEDKFKTKAVTATSKLSKMPEISQPKTTDANVQVQAPAELTTKTSPGITAIHQTTQPQLKAENQTSLPVSSASTHHHKHHEAVSTSKSPTSSMPSSHKATSASALDNQKDLMVQVGTFSIAGNAQTLVDKLHAKGFAAEAQKMKTSKGEMTRVIVGKKGLNHTQAETLRRELEKSMNIQGYIISHAKD